jgi:hypothetical protein
MRRRKLVANMKAESNARFDAENEIPCRVQRPEELTYRRLADAKNAPRRGDLSRKARTPKAGAPKRRDRHKASRDNPTTFCKCLQPEHGSPA